MMTEIADFYLSKFSLNSFVMFATKLSKNWTDFTSLASVATEAFCFCFARFQTLKKIFEANHKISNLGKIVGANLFALIDPKIKSFTFSKIFLSSLPWHHLNSSFQLPRNVFHCKVVLVVAERDRASCLGFESQWMQNFFLLSLSLSLHCLWTPRGGAACGETSLLSL